MYCIKCFKQNKKTTAEYIYKGTSICAEHLSQKVTPKQREEEPLLAHNRSKPKLAATKA